MSRFLGLGWLACILEAENVSYGLYLSASGANAQSHRMEVLSHNLANVNTPGFKPHLAMLQAREGAAIARGLVSPDIGSIHDQGGGTTAQQTQTHFLQGPIEQTGRDTDFAINDTDAFFVVEREGEQLLTRAGNFMFDATGRMVTPNGDPVLGQSGQAIQIDPRLPYDIRDGAMIQQDGTNQALMLVRPSAAGDLSRVGDTFYRPLNGFEELPPTERPVIRGALENSGVQPTGAMMELIETSRVYEANLRLIQHHDQSTGSLIGRILRS